MSSNKRLITIFFFSSVILNLSYITHCSSGGHNYQLQSGEKILAISAALNSSSANSTIGNNSLSNVIPSAGNIMMKVPYNSNGSIQYIDMPSDPINSMNLQNGLNSINYKLSQGHVVTIKYTIAHAANHANYYNFSVAAFSDDTILKPIYSSQPFELTGSFTIPAQDVTTLSSQYGGQGNLSMVTVSSNSVNQTDTVDFPFPSKTRTSTTSSNVSQVPSVPSIPLSFTFILNTNLLKAYKSLNIKFHPNFIAGVTNPSYEASFTLYPVSKKTTIISKTT